MTREERKLQRRQNLLMALCWLIVLVWAACLLCTYCGAACELEGVSNGQAVTGALVWGGLVTQLAVWLDRPGKGARRG